MNSIEVMKTKGVSIGARKNHTAAAYKGSMIVYGGQTENGMVAQDMIVFHMDTSEWVKIQLKPGAQLMQPVVQGGACSVIPPKNATIKDSFKARKVSDLNLCFNFFCSLILSRTVCTTSVVNRQTENLATK